jgi:hypothetical protein
MFPLPTGGLPSHLSPTAVTVPEGFAVTLRCLRCGGRGEAIAELRPYNHGFASLPDIDMDAAIKATDTLAHVFRDLVREMKRSHAACVHTALQHEWHEQVSRTFVKRIHAAMRQLCQKKRVTSTLTTVWADGNTRVEDITDLPTYCGPHDQTGVLPPQIAHMQFQHRERARARSAPLVGVILMGQCAGPTAEHASTAQRYHFNREYLGMTVITRSSGSTGYSHITRSRGLDGASRVTCAPFVCRPLVEPFAVADGHFALTDSWKHTT